MHDDDVILFGKLLGVAIVLLVVLLFFVSLRAEVKPLPAWTATAYCKGQVTAAGVPVKRGMAASDPRYIPLGSVIRVSTTSHEHFDGIYTVLDTGPEIKGREIDLYVWSCYEALDFGRRSVQVEVLRHGWMPNERVTR